MVIGQTERAIRNYEKSQELNPDNTNAVDKLRELRGDLDAWAIFGRYSCGGMGWVYSCSVCYADNRHLEHSMPLALHQVPRFSGKQAARIASDLFGIEASARELPSDRDQNFCLTVESSEQFVLKIANSSERREVIEAQNKAMEYIAGNDPSLRCPRVRHTKTDEQIATISGRQGDEHFVRLLTRLPGTLLAESRAHDPDLLRSLGRFLGQLDRALDGFSHPGARRDLEWDLRHASSVVRGYLELIPLGKRRTLVERFLVQFESEVAPALPELRRSVIHNDANDYNVLVDGCRSDRGSAIGIIDFGDMVETHTVFEPVVAAAYVILDSPALLASATHLVSGYHESHPLTELESELVYDLIVMRLCTSVAIASHQVRENPVNEYLVISQRAAWATLEQLTRVDQNEARAELRRAVGGRSGSFVRPPRTTEELLQARVRQLGGSVRVAYDQPLKIVRGWMQYLYDESGRAYLDAVNNVCHVGHCHPKVVRAAQRQIAMLNTNTRYLHDNLASYAERLCATLPEPLNVCYFVCSGSEANELALRLARTHTDRSDVVVVEGAYHGNTSSLVDISPYKHSGPGGSGPPPHVHQVSMPDRYRGLYKDDESAGEAFASHVKDAIERARKRNRAIAAFFCESLLSCGGQIVLPKNYLKTAYAHVRETGGLCIADEVQVGFGRVGTHFWGFETQGVIPDIVTLGKPIGNGHPLAAVITSPEIAESFDNGMEYFNTFGGNPVSCAVGLAVLDVIEEERLQDNARIVGARLEHGLERLMRRHDVIGDVRGLGLFLGVELVHDRTTLEPAADVASDVVERMKACGILVGADGSLRNVLKIKPPMVFSEADADFLVERLDKVLRESASSA